MLAYRQFLFESAFTYHHQSGDDHVYSHEHKIGGHHIDVVFHHQGKGHYDAQFAVDDSTNRGAVKDPKTAKAIGHHIQKTVHQFVNHAKPTHISMAGADDTPGTMERKHKIYGHFANSLARKIGGKVGETEYGEHIVKTKNKIQDWMSKAYRQKVPKED